MLFKKLVVVVLVVLLIGMGVTAFAAHNPDKSGGTLVVGLHMKIDTLDNFTSALEETLRVLGLVCEPLVVYDDNLQVQPLLAKSWSVSKDQLTWSFQLKKGIKFQDGTPFNATTYVDWMQNWFLPKTWNAWEFKPVKKLVVTGEYSFNIVLNKPYPMLINYLADPWNVIESPVARKKYGNRYGFDALVGTGPYVFEKWIRGDEVVLKRNPDYHHGPAFLTNQGPAYPDTIIFRILPEPITRVAELQHGNVDLLWRVPLDALPDLKKDPHITVMTHPSVTNYYVQCNMGRPIMQDKLIREAINHAIDRDAIINAVFHGYAQISYSILPPNATGYWKGSEQYAKPVLTYNPDESRKLLNEAGWVLPPGKQYREKDGQTLQLDLVTMNTTTYKMLAEVVKAMLAKVGIDVNLEIFDAAAASARWEAGNYDFTVGGWTYSLGEATLAQLLGSAAIPNPNYERYSSPTIDANLKIVRLGKTQAEREAAAAKIQQQVIQDQIMIPLVTPMNVMAARTDIGGLNELNEHPWWLDLVAGLVLYVQK